MLHYDFPLVPFLFATALAVNGLRKRTLSPSGAAAAFLTGIAMLSLPLRTPGISLIVFYLLGSRATKAGHSKKAALEDGHDGAGAGYRTAAQVFANSASALAATLLWGALHAPGFPGARAASVILEVEPGVYRHDAWCPLDRTVSDGWSRALLYVVLGHFACCLGDTLASELGILVRSPPILLTTLQRVPPGTNGALSVAGTAASVAGGAVMGLSMWATLAVENGVCRAGGNALLGELLYWGALAGGAGSLLDSLLGATLQQTQYSETRKRILIDTHSRPSTPAPGGGGGEDEGEEEKVKIVSGVDVLTNNQVNLISSTVTALALAYVA